MACPRAASSRFQRCAWAAPWAARPWTRRRGPRPSPPLLVRGPCRGPRWGALRWGALRFGGGGTDGRADAVALARGGVGHELAVHVAPLVVQGGLQAAAGRCRLADASSCGVLGQELLVVPPRGHAVVALGDRVDAVVEDASRVPPVVADVAHDGLASRPRHASRLGGGQPQPAALPLDALVAAVLLALDLGQALVHAVLPAAQAAAHPP